MSDHLAVRDILSSSQAEPSRLVPPTALGNVHTSDGFCGSHRNMRRQHRARVRGCPLLTSRSLILYARTAPSPLVFLLRLSQWFSSRCSQQVLSQLF